MFTLRNLCVAFALAIVVIAPSAAHAETSNTVSLIESLMKQLAELQTKLAELKGDIKEALKDGLEEGMTDEDIAKIQELLATDPAIYPKGLKTGYFGPLTKEALKKFQAKHELEVTGEIDEDTKELLEEYLGEKFGGKIPPGLLTAPGIREKVEKRFAEGCDDAKGMAFLCKKLKDKHGHGHDDDEDDDHEHDDDSDEDDEDFDVEVEIEDGETTVSFSFDGEDYEVTVAGTDEDDVLAAVADELDVAVADLDEDLENEIKDELEDAAEDAEDDESDFDVEVEIEVEGATTTVTIEFEFDGEDYDVELASSDEDDVLAAVADELDVDEDDVDNELWDAIEAALEEAVDELDD